MLTASDEHQAEGFRAQIRQRKLPTGTEVAVIPDRGGQRVGSGGATLSVIRYVKKKLGRRYDTVGGKWIQRDLYSSFLLMNSAEDLQHTDRARCMAGFDKFLVNHDRCIASLQNSNRKLFGSFGFSRTA